MSIVGSMSPASVHASSSPAEIHMTPMSTTVHLLIPTPTEGVTPRSAQEQFAFNYAQKELSDEMDKVIRQLGYTVYRNEVTLQNYTQTIDEIPASELIFSLCRGNEQDGVPGLSVAKYLEDRHHRMVGCSSEFIACTEKLRMKETFANYNISTPASVFITRADALVKEKVESLRFPVFVKPGDSWGCAGVSEHSLCYDIESVFLSVEKLLDTFSLVLVEEFVDGPEFVILVSGDSYEPHSIFVFNPIQISFLSGHNDQYLTFSRRWLTYSEACKLESVADNTKIIALTEIARRSYIALCGIGYCTVDVRQDEQTRQLYVLDVNPCPRLLNESPAAVILLSVGVTVPDFVSFLLHGEEGTIRRRKVSVFSEDNLPEARSDKEYDEDEELAPPQVPKKPFKITFDHSPDMEIEDGYHWLCVEEDPDVMAHIEAENAFARACMSDTQHLQTSLVAEFAARKLECDISAVEHMGDWFYYFVTERDISYPRHCRRFESMDSKEQVILDENEWAAGEDFFTLGAFEVSPDHNWLALSTDTTGSERFTLYIKSLTDDKLTDVCIPNISWHVRWAADNKTVFYTKFDNSMRSYAIYRHRVNVDHPEGNNDVCVYEEKDHELFLTITQTSSKRFLLLNIVGQDTNEIRFCSSSSPFDEFCPIISRKKGMKYMVTHHGSYFYVATNDAGLYPNYRVFYVRVDSCPPSEGDLNEFIPHRDDVLVSHIEAYRHHLAVWEWSNAKQRIRIQDLSDYEVHYIEFKDEVYSVFPGARHWDTEDAGTDYFNTTHLTFSYTSFLQPLTVYTYDMDSRRRHVRKSPTVLGFVPERYRQEMIFASSDDGNNIPICLVWNAEVLGSKIEEAQPCLLCAYGAYGGVTPNSFCEYRLSLLDRGFIFAIAHVRGCEVNGARWYQEGKLLHKKNTFADVVCCAKHLIRIGYTIPEKLAFTGRSAGGLICGALANSEENLFAVILADVPFMDCIGSMSTPNMPWVAYEYAEWGNPFVKEMFDYMASYDPYLNVKEKPYPHILFTAGLNDTRVGFWEPAKMCLRIRESKVNETQQLLVTRLEGHLGSGSRIDNFRSHAFQYTFLITRLLGKERYVVEGPELSSALPTGGDLTAIDLYKMFHGFHLTMLLNTSIEVGIFEFLDKYGASTSKTISRGLALDHNKLSAILDALVAVGLVEKQFENTAAAAAGLATFVNSLSASAHLLPGKPSYMGDLRHHFLQPRNLALMTKFSDTVKRTFQSEVPLQELKVVEGKHCQWLVRCVASTIGTLLGPWASRRKPLHALDISGAGVCLGQTLITQQVSCLDSSAQIWTLVFPNVAKESREETNQITTMLQGRLSLIEGDVMTSNLGGPYDLVIAMNLFSWIPKDQRKPLLNRISSVLQPSGRLCIVDLIKGIDNTGSCVPLASLMVAAHRKDAAVMSLDIYQRLMTSAGYITPLIHTVEGTPLSLLITAKNVVGRL